MEEREKIFEDFTRHLLFDQKPSEYFNKISSKDLEVYPFCYLKKLKDTEQSKIYHPEGSVWNHTMLVIDEAAKVREKSKDKQVFMWAALLHDIGKPDTTKYRKGKITSYGHEEVGAELVEIFLKEFIEDKEFIEKVGALVRWHMQILFAQKDSPFQNVKKMKTEVDIEEIALIGWCDRMGRKGADDQIEKAAIQQFLKKNKL
jgi:uncharacterized domain HDIG